MVSKDKSEWDGWYLVRVYNKDAEPFATASDLPRENALDVFKKVAPRIVLDLAEGQDDMAERTKVEDWLRAGARATGVDIRKENPVYFALTRDPAALIDYLGGDVDKKVIVIPTSEADFSASSFTYDDSFPNYKASQGVPFHGPNPLHGTVFNAEQMREALKVYGEPKADPLSSPRYIEVQMWDKPSLKDFPHATISEYEAPKPDTYNEPEPIPEGITYKPGLMHAFARSATKEDGSANDFVDTILRERPDLKGEMVYVPSQGAEGYTVFIGNEIFKGPRATRAYNLATNIYFMDQEVDFLKRLEGKDLPVPRVTYLGKDAAFYGMTRVPGVPLGFDFEERLNDGQLHALAKDIIDFVIKMAKALPEDPTYGYWMNTDMHAGNIMIDPKTKRLSGVIDFGNVEESHSWRIPYKGRFANILKQEFDARKQTKPQSVPSDLSVRYSMAMTL